MRPLLFLSTALILTACGGNDAYEDDLNEIESPVEIETAAETDPMDETDPMMDETDTMMDGSDMMRQSFTVNNSSNIGIGTVAIEDVENGVQLTLNLNSIPEGTHAIHFHEMGQCDTPDFTSSGGHYNPSDVNHGFNSDTPNPHAGDMRNFDAPVSGLVQTTIMNERVSLSEREGFAPLFDADNTALIIHAGADDYESQPSGDAGGRIACAVIAPE